MQKKIYCINHKKRKAMNNAIMCEECYDNQNKYLKTRIRDVETYDEDRYLFLTRKAKELGLTYTNKDIKSMMAAGMTDHLILKTENYHVWCYGNEQSKALPYHYE